MLSRKFPSQPRHVARRALAARPGRFGMPAVGFGLGVGALLALGPDDASAAALGNLASSAGLIVTFVTVLLLQASGGHAPAGVLSGGAVLLLLLGLGTWLWRSRLGAPLAAGSSLATLPGAPIDTRGGARGGLTPRAFVLPQDCPREPLLADLRAQFLRVQAAWDRVDLGALGLLTTPEMLDELCAQRQVAATEADWSRTEVVTLHAELLAYEALPQVHLASVEFSGLMRETADSGATAFRELWLLARAADDHDSTWRLARHQALM